jgi:hypothetical protein
MLAGHREPWDTDGAFYVVALVVAGFVAGSLVPRPLWAHYLGALVGQVGYGTLFLPPGALSIPIVALGVAFLLGYTLVFLAAAALAAFARTRLGSRSGHV